MFGKQNLCPVRKIVLKSLYGSFIVSEKQSWEVVPSSRVIIIES